MKALIEHRNPKINADTIEVDFSGISAYGRCAKQYEFRYVKGIKSVPGIALLEGSSYHAGVERNNLHKIKTNKDLPPKAMTDVFMEDFKVRTTREDVDWQGENENKIFKRAKSMFIEYSREIAPGIKPTHAEEKVEKTLTVDGVKLTLYGTVDLDTHDRLYDYKTTSKPKSQSEVDQTIQLSLYALMRKKPKVGIIQFVKAANPWVGILTSERKAQDIMWALTVAKERALAIQAGYFPPTEPTNWVCQPRWCGYYDKCRGAV